jgi:hypothetical protein
MTAGVSATGIPTGSPPTPINNLPSPKAIPSGVRPPIPGIKIGGSAALIGVGDFANRLSEGQSVGDAAKGASYTTAGSFAGGAIGFALGGPVGLMVGSMVGGALAGAVYDAAFPPSTEPQPPSGVNPYSKALSFPSGVRYTVFSTNNGRQISSTTFYFQLYSPKTYSTPGGAVVNAWVFEFRSTPTGNLGTIEIDPNTLEFLDPLPDNQPSTPGGDRRNLPRTGSPSSPVVSNPPASIPATSAPGAAKIPGGIGGIPAATVPGTPPENSNRGMNPPTIAPSPRANPLASPAGTLPATPNPFQSPIPGLANKGGTITPILGGLSGPSPDAMTEKNQPTPEGQTVRMTTKTPAQSLAPTPPAPTPAQADEDIVKRLQDMDAMLIGLAASIATLLAKPLSPASPIDLNGEDFQNAVAAGNCRTTQPGGCMRKEFDGIGNQNKANSDKLDAINAGLQGLDLAGTAALSDKLDKIDNKLGPQLPDGGISGLLKKTGDLLGKTWDFLQIDRVLNVLNFTTSLHNAYMLSSNIGQTLFSAIGNILDVFGVEDKEGGALDVGAMVAKWTDNFAKKLFGVSKVEGIKAEWKKLNRIYQAAANVMWSVQSIFDSMRSLQEIAIENTGKIGNALRKAGAVLENAYGPLVERATARNATQKRWDNIREGLESVENAISTVDSAASEVLSVQETLTELQKQRKEVEDSVTAYKSEESKKEADTKAVSVAPSL